MEMEYHSILEAGKGISRVMLILASAGGKVNDRRPFTLANKGTYAVHLILSCAFLRFPSVFRHSSAPFADRESGCFSDYL